MRNQLTSEVNQVIDGVEAIDSAVGPDASNKEFRLNRLLALDDPETWGAMTAGIDPIRGSVIRELIRYSNYGDDASYPTERSVEELRRRTPGLLQFVEHRLGAIATPGTVVSETRMLVVDGGILNKGSATRKQADVSAIVALLTTENMPITTSRPHQVERLPDYSGVWVESPSALWMLRPSMQFDYPHPLGAVGSADMRVFGDPFYIDRLWTKHRNPTPRFDARIGRNEISERIIENSISRSSNPRGLNLDMADITVPGALLDEPLQETEVDRYARIRDEDDDRIIDNLRNRIMTMLLKCSLDELELQLPAYDHIIDALEHDPVQVLSPKIGYSIALQGLGIRSPGELEEELTSASRKVHTLMTRGRKKNVQEKTAFLSDVALV